MDYKQAYQILGVKEGASMQEVVAAFEKGIKECTPKKKSSTMFKSFCEKQKAEITKAGEEMIPADLMGFLNKNRGYVKYVLKQIKMLLGVVSIGLVPVLTAFLTIIRCLEDQYIDYYDAIFISQLIPYGISVTMLVQSIKKLGSYKEIKNEMIQVAQSEMSKKK